MHPPLSMIFFTTLTGAAQGLLLALVALDAAARLGHGSFGSHVALAGAAVVLVLSAIGLVAASFHLGHPMRAWRAVSQWRTSWLSREVIVLPAFMFCVAAWGASHAWDGLPLVGSGIGWGLAASVLALLLYLCTGMIYGAIKAIRQWATPLTPVNYLILGLASGSLLAAAVMAVWLPQRAPLLAAVALVLTVLGAATRGYFLWRGLNLVPKTTLQSAIGARHPRIRQTAQGAMGGGFNAREFFHGRSAQAVLTIRWTAGVLGFVLPAVALAAGAGQAGPLTLGLLFAVQYGGLLAERWSFFAEGRHTQTLYGQSD